MRTALQLLLTPYRSRIQRLRSHFAAALAAASVALLCSFAARAQSAAAPEEVEAAYLHKFMGYVDWPPKVFASPTAPLVVAVVGSDRMYELFSSAVAGRPVQGRPVEVRRLARPDAAAEIHLVFIGKDAWKDLPAWVAALKDRPVVVVTDAPQGVERGAALAFVQTGRRVRFEASLAAADQSGFKLSARLLAVAERVVGAVP